MAKPYEYVNKYYGLQVKPGMRVKALEDSKGRSGVVVRKRSYDHYVHVKLDGMKFDLPFHPSSLEYQHD